MDCVSKYENKSAIEKFEIVLHDVTFVAENNKLLWINKYMLSMCYLTNWKSEICLRFYFI